MDKDDRLIMESYLEDWNNKVKKLLSSPMSNAYAVRAKHDMYVVEVYIEFENESTFSDYVMEDDGTMMYHIPEGDINNTPGLQERAKEIILAGQDTVHGKIPDVDNYDIDLMLAIPRGEMAVIHKDEYSLASQYRILFRESENGELREIAQEGAFDIDGINTHFVILNKTDMDISHMGDI